MMVKKAATTKKERRKKSTGIKKSQVTVSIIKELRAEFKFYLTGEIVIDLDLFKVKEDDDDFFPNPTNQLKVLQKMSLFPSHLEFETTSLITPISEFTKTIELLKTVEHPKARELVALLQDYQQKVQKRENYAKMLINQYKKEDKQIDWQARRKESLETASQVIKNFSDNNKNSIFFFVVRSKGFESIDVLKSGYSHEAIKVSGYTLDEFQQFILRNSGIPIRHQNCAWDYIKEKMYSNFHNKNYSGISRKIAIKNGTVMDVLVSVQTIPINVNLSPDTQLIDINDYVEILSILPNNSLQPSKQKHLALTETVISSNPTLKQNPHSPSQYPPIDKSSSALNNDEYNKASKNFIDKYYNGPSQEFQPLQRKSRKLLPTELSKQIVNIKGKQIMEEKQLDFQQNDKILVEYEKENNRTRSIGQAPTNDSEFNLEINDNLNNCDKEAYDEEDSYKIEEEKDEQVSCYSITNQFQRNCKEFQ